MGLSYHEVLVSIDYARVLVLAGAGLSAESGIPTFRGEDGYWTVGSRNYRPEQMATREAFERMPTDVWRWYLYRRGVCRRAQPNAGHQALVELEERLGERFTLVTQNVDGLSRRAGNRAVLEIHGNLDRFRCADACTAETYPLPEDLVLGRGEPLPAQAQLATACPRCGGPGRPHVLWFDEGYDEPLYRMDSALEAARDADLLITVGSSGATMLPLLLAHTFWARDAPIIDVNPAENPFGELAQDVPNGHALQGSASELLPPLCAALG